MGKFTSGAAGGILPVVWRREITSNVMFFFAAALSVVADVGRSCQKSCDSGQAGGRSRDGEGQGYSI